MKPKFKVLIFNFLAFALLFVLFRYILHLALTIQPLYMSLIAAITASVLAPKFAVAKIEGHQRIVMKWVFIKGYKVL